jgi:exosortase/archaeosortase family protein
LRFLIASIAFGVLYSLLMYRSPMRRAIFIIASIIMPVIANGFRALGIVWLGHILGSAEAAATDHILYGWIFFSIVILLLIVAGLPFREDEQFEALPVPMTPDPRAARQGLAAGLVLAALAAIAPMIVLGLNQASATPNVALRPLDLSPACVNEETPPLIAPGGTPGRSIIQHVDCDGLAMTVQIEVFAARSTAGPINAERRHLTRIGGAEDWSEAPLTARNGEPLRPWRLVRGSDPSYLAAAGLWINGAPMPPGIAMRLSMARSSVFGGASAPVLVVITPTADWKHIDMKQKTALEKRIAAVLEARGGIGDQVRTIAANVH